MKTQTYTLEIITPCFCGGADPAKAEIRAPSIRGQLRWWFRTLGGSKSDEDTIFGSIAKTQATSSSVIIKVCNVQKKDWKVVEYNQNDAQGYVWHYASVSGTDGRGAKGPRWTQQGALGVGTTLELQIIRTRTLSNELDKKFQSALEAFLCFGTLGLRGSRGLGSFFCKEISSAMDKISLLTDRGFQVKTRKNPEIFTTSDAALKDWAAWLRFKLRKENKAASFSPLGGSEPRQASAIKFRPIKLADNQFTWIAFEAPAERVLGNPSRRNSPLLTKYDFTGSSPQPPKNTRCR